MAELIETKKRDALSGWPMILGWLAMMIFALHACTRMVGAGDTWVAMACGRHFINHGVDTVEPFSANSHKAGPTEKEIKTWPTWAQWITDKVGLETVKRWHPTGWVNQNWLTHVIFYWLTHLSPFADAETFSYNTLVYWKFAIYIITVICVFYTARLLRVNPALSAVFACFAMFVGRTFLDVRPAGFSNLLVAVFLLILALTTYRNVLYIWLIVPVAVFWCNVHGGYIYAFIMLAPFAILHLLMMLPKRWSVSLHSILTWMALYVMAYKFLNNELLSPIKSISPISPGDDWLFHILLVAIIASLATAAFKQVKNEIIYGYHIVASLIVFFSLLPRFFPSIPLTLNRYVLQQITQYVRNSQFSFVIAFFVLTGLGLVVTFLKNRLVCIKLKGIYHTVAAGFVAFLAVIIFNPFHLTNLTHTFVISVSEHAEMWRTVNEWHPAFEWKNPVGTSFTFLILYILSIGLPVFWLFSHFLKPKFLKAPKNELEAQRKQFTTLSKIFGCAAVVSVAWVTFISFSFLNLDAGSFLFCTMFVGILLLSIYKSVHFIYLAVPLTLVALSSSNPVAKYLGRYIYPFVLLPAYVIVHMFASLFSFSKTPKTKPNNIAFVAITAVVALILMMVIFHPFIKSELPSWSEAPFGRISQALKPIFHLRRLWRPLYEGKKALSYAHLFTVLYIVNIASIGIWLTAPSWLRIFRQPPNKASEQSEADTYQLPKIDLALIVIAALTVYMAYRSRRFIPIAAIAACPIMAMFIDEMVRTISAARSFHRQNRLTAPPMTPNLQTFFTVGGAAAVLIFGTWWGLKFKRVYLDPWPTDPKLSSIFMRMTASDAKPFYACKFIKDNKIKGKMFNYWTEGGFIAYGQQPDPNTGKTPLQLFMDGRAQAAYEHRAYGVWSTIMEGGPTVRDARTRKRKLTDNDYPKIGQWMDKELKKHNVWVVLMPYVVFQKPPVRGLEFDPNWRLVFFNNKQKLFVDVTTPQGKELLTNIGRNIYPDDLSKNLIIAHNLLVPGRTKEEHKQGLDFAIKAFKANPSQEPMHKILLAARFLELRTRVNRFCKDYFDDFLKKKNDYAKKDGYHNRLVAALVAGNRLLNIAKKQKNKEVTKFYSTKMREYTDERVGMLEGKRW